MILGIDLGSSWFKAELIDQDSQRIGYGQAPVTYNDGIAHANEMPVVETEDAFRTAISEALRSAGVKPESLLAIAITSQAQTFTIRTPDGNARSPFISWRDTRGWDSVTLGNTFPDFAQHSSLYECQPLLMVSKLAWLQSNADGPGVQAEDLVLMLPTWFVLQLTGRPVVDANIASMSGLYTLEENRWWDRALEVCDISAENLPECIDLGGVAGATVQAAQRYDLPPGIPIVLAGNDQTAGAYGAEIHDTNALLITLGTAQVVYSVCSDLPMPTPGVMRGSYPDGRYYQLVADELGTGTVEWACTQLDGIGHAAEFDKMAEKASEVCGGLQFVADTEGGLGQWVGEDDRATDADRAQAVFVCLVERLSAMIEKLGKSSVEKPIVLAGGGSNSRPWRKLIESRLGRTFSLTTSASPALGAARLALRSVSAINR